MNDKVGERCLTWGLYTDTVLNGHTTHYLDTILLSVKILSTQKCEQILRGISETLVRESTQ